MSDYTLSVKIEADSENFEDAMSRVKSNTEEASKSTSVFKDNLLANLASAAVISSLNAVKDAVGGICGAVKDLVTGSVSGFSELEQNLGGSEAVFSRVAGSVQTKARRSFETMGTSTSEYLATANKMGALFKGSGVETERAMELTTKAMERAADMASVMGIDTQVALDSVAGAAKGNLTMMDNLGVAMNATTLEAYRLSKGIDTAYSKMSNTEKAELAMSYFFEKTKEYAGNFKRESAETISGSIGKLKATWQNLVDGMANSDANMRHLTDNFLNAFGDVQKNLEPVLGRIATTIPDVVSKIGSALLEKSPELMEKGANLIVSLGTGLMSKAPELVAKGKELLSGFIGTIMERAPEFLAQGQTLLTGFISGLMQSSKLVDWVGMVTGWIDSLSGVIAENLPGLVPIALNFLMGFSATLREQAGTLVDSALNLIRTLADALIANIPVIIETVPTIVTNIAGIINDNAPKLLATGITIIGHLVMGILQAVPTILTNLPQIVVAIVSVFSAFNWVNLGTKIIGLFKTGIKTIATTIPPSLHDIMQGAITKIQAIPWSNLGSFLIDKIAAGMLAIATAVPRALLAIGKTALTVFQGIDWAGMAANVIRGIAMALTGGVGDVVKAVKDVCFGIIDSFVGIFQIHSPSKKMQELTGYIVDGFINTFEELPGKALSAISDLGNRIGGFLGDLADDALTWGSDIIDGIVSGISSGISYVQGAVSDVAQSIRDFIGFSEPDEGPLSDFHTYMPDMIGLMTTGIERGIPALRNAASMAAGVLAGGLDIGTMTGTTIEAVGGGATFGNVNINVYGAEGQDVEALADAVSDRIIELARMEDY